MRRVELTVAYDGTNYAGWQVQDNALTVEEVLNRALKELTGEEIAVTGASRTDAGVHARGNLAVFDTASPIPPEKFTRALSARLPKDICVVSSREVPEDYHPRRVKTRKTYEYRILNSRTPDPLRRLYTWHRYEPLDVTLMQQAAAYLVGEHDFASFCSPHTQAKTTVRTIHALTVERADDEIRLRVTGNGFLYNMVRIIAGTLAEVGRGQTAPEKIPEILAGCDREASGPTAPPQGLTLIAITPEADDPESTEK